MDTTNNHVQRQTRTAPQEYDAGSMAYLGTLRGERWASPGSQLQSQQMVHSNFDPSQPSFQPSSHQPSSMEVARYSEPRSAPQQYPQSLERQIYELRLHQLGARHSQEYHITTLQQATHENSLKYMALKDVMQRDLRSLQRKIEALEAGDDDEVSGINYTQRASSDIPNEVFEGSDEDIAKAYLARAEEKQTAAAKLRRAARTFLGGADVNVTVEELDAIARPEDKVIGFACCSIVLDSLEAMSEHFEKSHLANTGSTRDEGKKPEAALQSTPARELSRPRPHAIEIKAPEPPKFEARAEEPKSEEQPKPADNTSEEHHEALKSDKDSWMPYAIRVMPPSTADVPASQKTFSFEHIHNVLKGEEWCDGYYFISAENPYIESQAYWILDEENEPFIPQKPGQHGAKITAVFNNTDCIIGPAPKNYMDCPVFMRRKGESEYRYYGQYSQTRFSDKIGYDTMMDHVPDSVRHHWAEQLAAVGRPQWVTDELRNHFWPNPSYAGYIPTDSAVNTPNTVATAEGSAEGLERRVMRDLEGYALQLKDHKKKTDVKVPRLSAQKLYDFMFKPDSDQKPGFRLYWEYMQCVGWDAKFENMMETFKTLTIPAAAPAPSTLSGSKANGKKPFQKSNGSQKPAPSHTAATPNGLAAVKRKTANGEKAKGKAKATEETADAWGPSTPVKWRDDEPAAATPAGAPGTKISASAAKDKGKNVFGMGDLDAAKGINEENKKLPPHVRRMREAGGK